MSLLQKVILHPCVLIYMAHFKVRQPYSNNLKSKNTSRKSMRQSWRNCLNLHYTYLKKQWIIQYLLGRIFEWDYHSSCLLRQGYIKSLSIIMTQFCYSSTDIILKRILHFLFPNLVLMTVQKAGNLGLKRNVYRYTALSFSFLLMFL
jgi:hypothetical protein